MAYRYEDWILTHCTGCRVDVDIPRSEWIYHGMKPRCDECGMVLKELEFIEHDYDDASRKLELRYDDLYSRRDD